MAHLEFILDGPAFEKSTRQVIHPNHIMPLQEETDVDIQLFQRPPVLPVPPVEQDEETRDAPASSLLNCILENACDRLHAFQEYEHYCFGVESGPDCDVPEDEFTDEMEDICSDEAADGDSVDLPDVNEIPFN